MSHRYEKTARGATRRDFLKTSGVVAGAALAGNLSIARSAHAQGKDILKVGLEQYLAECTIPKDTIDTFLDPDQSTWAQFDPIVGYTLYNSMQRDGIDGSSTISTVQKLGARTPHNYTDKPCRINTYGNSFTQCEQVSDGETWQEYLAAHLGEPIRNFGVGGFGVYQAYRRLTQIEQSEIGGNYVILYIWGDDHCRSLMRCRYAITKAPVDAWGKLLFHGNFWAHVEMDLDSGNLVEKENPLSTPESLYRMTEPEFMVDALKDDLMLQLYVANVVDPSTLDLGRLKALAEILGAKKLDTSSNENLAQTSRRLAKAYGFAATRFIVEKTSKFCKQKGKKLMVCILCPTAIRQLLNNQPRYDQEIADYLARETEPFFDMNIVHLNDYRDFNLSVGDYMKRYFIGHYSPVGNHFFAYSIKDKIVDWLNPKPITYLDDKSKKINFEGYLPE